MSAILIVSLQAKPPRWHQQTSYLLWILTKQSLLGFLLSILNSLWVYRWRWCESEQGQITYIVIEMIFQNMTLYQKIYELLHVMSAMFIITRGVFLELQNEGTSNVLSADPNSVFGSNKEYKIPPPRRNISILYYIWVLFTMWLTITASNK